MSTKVNSTTAKETEVESLGLQTEMSTKVNLTTTTLTGQEFLSLQTELSTMELGLMARSMAAFQKPTQMVKRRQRSG